MEKKHLTFSKRTIRQHGGVDPSIRSLKKDALASSKMGFTLADPHDAVHCYMAAERMEREAEKREKAHAAWLRKEEETRQGNERRMLNKSLAIMLDEFKDEWKHKRTLVDEEITHIQQAVRERADAQRHFLEKKYGKERIPSVKYSTFTRDMIKQGKKLADAQCYEDVMVIHRKMEAVKQQEEEQWLIDARERQERGRQQLEVALAREQVAAHEKIASLQSKYEKARAKAKDVVMQRCKNLTHDMDAAFRREWLARPEVAVSAKISNPSRTKTSATFLGSRTQDKRLGDAIDLPSICQAHFGEAELTGTLKDWDAVHAHDIHNGPLAPPKLRMAASPKKSPLHSSGRANGGVGTVSVGVEVLAQQ